MNRPFPNFAEGISPEAPPPPVRRWQRTVGLILAVGAAGLLICVFVCGGLVYLGSVGVANREPTAEEKEAVVTIRDLEPHGAEAGKLELREIWKTKRHLDGTVETEYEYDPDLATGPGDHVSVQSSVLTEHTESGARQAFSMNITAYKTGLTIFGVKTRDQPHVMGDVNQSYFALITKDEIPVGNMVVIQKGKQVLGLLIVGLYFEEPGTLEEILRKKVRRAPPVQ